MATKRVSPQKRSYAARVQFPQRFKQADKGFDSLEVRLTAILHKVKLFGDFQDIPEEYISAAAVVQEAAQELDQLWHEIDVWDVQLNSELRSRLSIGMSLKEALTRGEERRQRKQDHPAARQSRPTSLPA